MFFLAKGSLVIEVPTCDKDGQDMHRHKWILKQVKVAIVREVEILNSLKFILKIIWEKEMSMGEGVYLGRRSFKGCVLRKLEVFGSERSDPWNPKDGKELGYLEGCMEQEEMMKPRSEE